MKFNVAIVGFGKVASFYINDKNMSRHYQYATHLQVILKHPDLHLKAVIDSDKGVEEDVKKIGHKIDFFDSVESERLSKIKIHLLVISTGSADRLGILKRFPNIKAVMVEKPIADTLQEATKFRKFVEDNNIYAQVNLWRRSDLFFRSLKDQQQLKKMLGKIFHANVVYGNGILNNGLHMFDFSIMLLGKVSSVNLETCQIYQSYKVTDSKDLNASFVAVFDKDIVVNFNAVDFNKYRENSIEIYGELGVLKILNEGLEIYYCPIAENRAMDGEQEIAYDKAIKIESSVGTAQYWVYDNLVEVMKSGRKLNSLNSDIATSFSSEQHIHKILDQLRP